MQGFLAAAPAGCSSEGRDAARGPMLLLVMLVLVEFGWDRGFYNWDP